MYALFIALCMAGAPAEPQNCAHFTVQRFFESRGECMFVMEEGNRLTEQSGETDVVLSLCIPLEDISPTGTYRDG